MRRLPIFLLSLALVGGGGIYVWRGERGATGDAAAPTNQARSAAGGGRRGAPRGDMPTSVLVTPSRYADVPVTLLAVGTAQALNTVTVRAQVDGRLVEVAIREGQEVRKGDVIARIDPTLYRAQYDQALARKAQNEATLANARLDLVRSVTLAQSDFGSKKQADTQRALVQQLEAQLKADQGALDSAKAYLDYTTVLAPIDGRTGIRVVDQGNIVKASDPGGLVVITQIRPITVLFNLAQQNLRAVNAALARGPVTVEAFDSDNRTVVDTGTLSVIDNQVDQTTGTVRLKATFPNATQQLWPGQFVNVRLTADVLKNVVTVPTAAVQRGPSGAFVYAVENDRAVLKPVEIGRQDESVSVVTSGVTPPEAVITTGFARLTNGDRVKVVQAEPAATSEPVVPTSETRAPGTSAGQGEGRRRAGRPGGVAPDSPQADGAPVDGQAADQGRRRSGGARAAGGAARTE